MLGLEAVMSLTILFEHAIGERVYRVVDCSDDDLGPSVQERHDRGQYAGYWTSWTVDEQAETATLEAWRKAKEDDDEQCDCV